MEIIRYPDRQDWERILKRPVQDFTELRQKVEHIIEKVQNKGDRTLFEFAEHYDKVALTSLRVSEAEWALADEIPLKLKDAIETARRNIAQFHKAQKPVEVMVETTSGVWCWRKALPIEKVGLYIPGGTAPLLSTFLMLAVPAQLAGCQHIVVCTPPNKEGKIDPAILYIAKQLGITSLFKAGGAQAVAAMAYGTETIPSVHKIFGPGNRYVTMAKQLVSLDGVAIDLPAGPSEVLIIADRSAQARFIAADLLSQAEHGYDSQVMLVLTEEALVGEVQKALEDQLQNLPRAKTARAALKNSRIIVMRDVEHAMELSNAYAPEHLILMTENAETLADMVHNAGSVFIGPWSPESAGDYASGTNHTLPTNGYAFSYSGVSLESFMKIISFQRLAPQGLRQLGPVIMELAQAEGLEAHKQAVKVRLQALSAMEKGESNNG